MKITYENDFVYIYDDNEEEMGHIEYCHEDKHTINALHTIVLPNFQGQGIAGQLVDALATLARKNNYKVIPTCSYVAKKIEDEKYQDIKNRR